MAIFDFIEQAGVGAGFVYKNTTACYYFDGTNFNQVLDPDYPSWAALPTITGITRSGNVATVTTTTAHGQANGTLITISGAVQTEYNGSFIIQNVTANTFDYIIVGTPKSVTSITRAVNTATATSNAHGYSNGDAILIAGATQVDYNGVFIIANVTANTFDYTVANTPVTPATGTITCTHMPVTPATGTILGYSPSSSTVRGIVYLDGTYYVMTPNGAIHGSDINNIASWSALNIIQSQMEPDNGICIARQLNLVVAFGAYSTEFFYDAGNPTGSPLLPYTSAMLEIGCAVAGSVAQTENTIYFMGVARQKGRSIYRLDGTTPSPISNPNIDRILNNDDLANVNSYCINLNGHKFYVLYLGTIGKTLVYDSTTGQWGEWTQTTASATKNITAASWANGVVTATVAGHGFNDGDVATIASSNPSGYNATKTTINVPDVNTITYSIASNPGTYVGSATVLNYTESAFNMASYVKAGNFDLVQDSTTGTVYAISTDVYSDNGNPIEFKIRTTKFDGGDNKKKFYPRAEIIGDKVSSTAYLRYSNDDYQTWSQYRPVDLSQQRSVLNRLGIGRRRAFEIRHHDTTNPLRLESLEITVEEGTR